MSFLTQLNSASAKTLHQMIVEYILSSRYNEKELFQVPTCPGPNFVLLNHFWVETGQFNVQEVSDYILTPSVSANLRNLVRVVLAKRFPVLIQVGFFLFLFLFLFLFPFRFCSDSDFPMKGSNFIWKNKHG